MCCQVVPAKIVSFGGLIERPWRTYIKLPCTAVGQPAVKRQWLKSYRAIQSWDGNLQVTENGDMTITSLQRSNSDNYTCHVENIHGADAIIYQIIVQGEFGVLFFRHNANPIQIYITMCPPKLEPIEVCTVPKDHADSSSYYWINIPQTYYQLFDFSLKIQ